VTEDWYRLISAAYVSGMLGDYYELEERLQEEHGFKMQDIWLV